jgi:hypothetical protein
VKKSQFLFLIVWLSFISVFIEVFSGFALWFAVRISRAMGRNTFIFKYRTWVIIHEWDAIPVMAFVLIHIFLHWKWIVKMFKSLFKWPTSNK